MWPFSSGMDNGEVIKNDLSSHDIISYSMDGFFVIAVVVVILVYRWRVNTNRLRQLERSVQRRELRV